MSVPVLTRKEAVKRIREVPPGRIYSVLVKKRTGNKELIQMACQNGVTKGVSGQGMAFDPTKRGLITVYKMAGSKSGFRCINIPGLKQIIIDGQVYAVK